MKGKKKSNTDIMRDAVPQKYRGLYDRAKGRSRSAAIRLFCLGCMGWSEKEVKLCTAPWCSLYKWRFGNENRATLTPKS